MMSQNSKLHQENNANEIKMKMIATQNVIKNKFHKAYANRIEHENKLKQPMRARGLLDVSSTLSGSATTLAKTDDNKNNKEIKNNHFSFNNPNEMCERLRNLLLIMCEDDVKQVEEVKTIINKLREQEILV